MAQKATFLILAGLLPVALSFQACTGCESPTAKFTSASNATVTEAGGGDGEPLDNKPDPGTYYRMIPGYLCNGQPSLPGRAEVSTTSVRITSLDPQTCREFSSVVGFDRIQHSAFAPSFLGFGSGLYLHMAQAPDPAHPTVPVIEAACRYRPSSGVALDLSVALDLQSRRLQATVQGAMPVSATSTDLWKALSPLTLDVGREVDAASFVYASSGFTLSLPRAILSAQGPVNGHLTATYAGQKFDVDVSCRTGSVYDVVSNLKPSFSADLGGGVLPSSLTFSRAGAGSYFDASGLIAFASPDQPRFDHDPISQAPLGLLLEEPRTNLLLDSGDMTNPVWSDNNGGQAITTTKDGTLVGLDRFRVQRLLTDPTFIWDRALQNVNISAGVNYTLSFFVQKGNVNGTRVFVWLSAGNETNIDFNLVDGTSAVYRENVITTVSHSSMPVAGGYRIFVTFTSTSSGTINVGLGPLSGNQGDYIYAAGAQLELGSGPTSYIATADQPVTRAEDQLAAVDVGWFQPLAGTFESDVSRPGTLASDVSVLSQLFAFDHGADEYSMALNPAQSFVAHLLVGGSGGDTPLTNSPASGAEAPQKVFLSYAAGNSVAGLNGVLTPLPASTPIGLTPTSLNLGGAGVNKWNAHLKAITYWPQRLDDLTLQTLTP